MKDLGLRVSGLGFRVEGVGFHYLVILRDLLVDCGFGGLVEGFTV